MEIKDSFLDKGIEDFLAKACNYFSFLCPNLLCHNSKRPIFYSGQLILANFSFDFVKENENPKANF